MTVRVIAGDCREVLPTLPADSFDCVVTSPPYWGLRDYGVAGQIGLEPTLAEYLETMVGVFRDLRRVLKPTGTCWLNIGDSYNAHPGQRKTTDKAGEKQGTNVGSNSAPSRHTQGMKPKDLCMVPNRLAILLQDDGWWVRSEIIWHKPNPMPESVTDRPTSAHEKVWLLTKSERYFYDSEAIAEPAIKAGQVIHSYGTGAKDREDVSDVNDRRTRIGLANWNKPVPETRNARNVWSIVGEPYRGAHYAVMPSALAERCIRAGCPERVCHECGAPYSRVTNGSERSCSCRDIFVLGIAGSVLDPFGGAGTTGLVADRLGRHATLIELNPANREMAAERVAMDSPLFAEVTA